MATFMLCSSIVLLSLVLLGACAGEYTQVYGEDSVALTVPIATATCTQEWM